tara:strand:- start:1331 stop:1462 length:132 start_codon:yes stop_codon:yes gene_type:complete
MMIEDQHKSMEQSEHATILYRCQGAVLALRKLKQIREEANGTN